MFWRTETCALAACATVRTRTARHVFQKSVAGCLVKPWIRAALSSFSSRQNLQEMRSGPRESLAMFVSHYCDLAVDEGEILVALGAPASSGRL